MRYQPRYALDLLRRLVFHGFLRHAMARVRVAADRCLDRRAEVAARALVRQAHHCPLPVGHLKCAIEGLVVARTAHIIVPRLLRLILAALFLDHIRI